MSCECEYKRAPEQAPTSAWGAANTTEPDTTMDVPLVASCTHVLVEAVAANVLLPSELQRLFPFLSVVESSRSGTPSHAYALNNKTMRDIHMRNMHVL